MFQIISQTVLTFHTEIRPKNTVKFKGNTNSFFMTICNVQVVQSLGEPCLLYSRLCLQHSAY